MSETKKGPWHWEEPETQPRVAGGRWLTAGSLLDASDNEVIVANDYYLEMTESDAWLIAAAPELLGLVKAIADVDGCLGSIWKAHKLEPSDSRHAERHTRLVELIRRAEAAINKAEGRNE